MVPRGGTRQEVGSTAMSPWQKAKGGRLALVTLVLVVAGALLATPLLAAPGSKAAVGGQGEVATRAQVLAEAAAVFAGQGREAAAQPGAAAQTRAGGQGRVAAGGSGAGFQGGEPGSGGQGASGPVLGLWQKIRGLFASWWQKVEVTLSLGRGGEPAGGQAAGQLAGQAAGSTQVEGAGATEAAAGQGAGAGGDRRSTGGTIAGAAAEAMGTTGGTAGTAGGSVAAGGRLEVDGRTVTDAAAIPEAHRAGVEAAVRAGLVQATDLTAGGALQPERPATVAWAATVLVRALAQAGVDLPEPNLQGIAGEAAGELGQPVPGVTALPEEQQKALAICLDLGIVQARVEAGAGPALQPVTPLPVEVWRSMLERAAQLADRSVPQDLGASGTAGAAVEGQGQTATPAGGGKPGGQAATEAGDGSPAPVDLPPVLGGKASLRLTGVLLESPGLDGLLASLGGSAEGSGGTGARAGGSGGASGRAGGPAGGRAGGQVDLRLRLDDGRVVTLPVDPGRLALQGGNALFLGIDLAGLLGQRVEVVIRGGTVAEIRPAP